MKPHNVDYEIIKETLASLLELNDGDELQFASGICLEVGAAARDAIDPTRNLCAINEEYSWVHHHCCLYTDDAYVDEPGKMTPKRRQFVLHLLDCISKEMKEEADEMKEVADD